MAKRNKDSKKKQNKNNGKKADRNVAANGFRFATPEQLGETPRCEKPKKTHHRDQLGKKLRTSEPKFGDGNNGTKKRGPFTSKVFVGATFDSDIVGALMATLRPLAEQGNQTAHSACMLLGTWAEDTDSQAAS